MFDIGDLEKIEKALKELNIPKKHERVRQDLLDSKLSLNPPTIFHNI